MPVEILMPELGESVHEATVTRWLVKEGDPIKEDDPVVEIMTDKVNTELPAPASGVLGKILVPEGGQVKVFEAMGIILEAGEASSAPSGNGSTPTTLAGEAVAAASAPVPTTPAEPVESVEEGERRFFTPLVRAMAKEQGLSEEELARIPGTGNGGRVTKKDVEAYLASGRTATPAAKPVEVAKPAELPKPEAPKIVEQPKPAPVAAGADQEVVQLVGMRKLIAEAMVRSSQVPTVSTVIEVDVSAMVRFREANKDAFQQQYGTKLTYTPFFIKALSEALLEFPMVNASLQGDHIVMNKHVNMGIAVALGKKGDEGLIVPVIKQTDVKSLVEIAKALDEIAAKARSNSLSLADVQGGTFTLTNPGSYGALFGTPMIVAPQAGIAGAYGIKKVPVIVDDMIAIRSMMYLVLTYDHRIVDGLLAGRFLQSVKQKLETFAFFK